MQVTLAKSAGFCFGVKRAVDQVYQEAEHSRMPVYTFGPIIHNETVVKDLEEKGVYAIGGIEELKHPQRNRCDPFPRGFKGNL